MRSWLHRGLCRAAPFTLAGAAWGCSVTALEERERAIALNECREDAQCGAGRCQSGSCVANQGELSTLLFELTPTATGNVLAGASFFALVEDVPLRSGPLELPLKAALPLTGSVLAEPRPEPCAPRFLVPDVSEPLPVAQDGSIPARVSFTPALGGFGLGVTTRSSVAQSSRSLDPKNPVPKSYGFAPSLPAGTYDIQIEPLPLVEPAGEACKFPPQFIRGLCIEGHSSSASDAASPGAEQLALALPLPLPSRLKLSITHREQQPLASGWVADMVDSVSGRVISTRVPLSLPSTAGGVTAYSVVLDYLPVIEHHECERSESTSSSELVRLTPPAGVVAPTLLFDRTALELFSPGAGSIEQLPRLPSPVSVEGHVFGAATKQPEAATLTFVGRSLEGVPAGVLASFVRTVETAEDGEFEVELLPGRYDVHVTPGPGDGSTLRSAREASWEIAATPARQAGRALELSNAITLAGSAIVPIGGGGARGANVVAEPSAAFLAETSVLSRALDGVQLGPRPANSVISGAAGDFTLSTDAGRFDLSIRPPEGSGFAWLVMPNLELSGTLSTVELEELELPLPIALEVHVTINGESGGAAVGARVRAFAATDATGAFTKNLEGAIFLPVAEGRVEGSSAKLMVPAFLHAHP